MDTKILYKIIKDSTRVFRKGELVEERSEGNLKITEVFGYPHTSEAPRGDNFDVVDMIFVDVVVDKAKAKKHREALIKVLNGYPQPDRLAGGPSYIELAPNFELEQEGALRVMALGKALGMWDILSGKTMGMSDDEAKRMAGTGFLNISGYKPK